MALTVKKALVVDDSRLARIALSKQLQKRNIDVDTAGNGTEALQYLRDACPDVVFMDYMMPDMDGFEAARRIFADPDCKKPPVVMYTSQDSEEDRALAREVVICGFLTKPSSDDSLDHVLATLPPEKTTVASEAAAAAVAASLSSSVAAAGSPESVSLSAASPTQLNLPWDRIRVFAKEAAQAVIMEAVDKATQEQLETVRSGVDEALQRAVERARAAAEEAARSSASSVAREVAQQVAGELVRQVAQQVAEDVVRRTVESQMEQSLPRAARQMLQETSPEVARLAAEKLRPAVAEEVRTALDGGLERLLAGVEFKTQVKGVVFEHILPSLQQALQPRVEKIALEASFRIAQQAIEKALASQMPAVEQNLETMVRFVAQEELKSVNRRWTLVVVSGAVLALVGVIGGILL
jgi:CheY-like chemotaxis protein